MSTVKISELTALTSADAADELVIVDDSAGVTKKITHANLANFGTRTVTAGAIDFSGLANAAGMTSEVLDDYEEGTWTPIYVPQTGSFTTMTYSFQYGTYQKIGDFVHIEFYVATSNVNTTGASGDLYIQGFPYVSSEALAVGFFAGRWNGDAVKFVSIEATGKIFLWSSNSDGLTRTNVSGLTTGAATFQNIINGTVKYKVS